MFSKFVRVKLENNKNLSVFQGRYLQEKQIKFYKKIEEIEDKFFNLIKHCDVDFSSLAILKNGKKEEFLLDTLNFVRKFVLNIEYHEQFKIKYLKTPKNIDKYLIFLKYLVRECSKANLFIKNEFFDIMLYIKAKTYNTYDYKDWHSVIMTPELRMYENKCMNTTTISLYLDKMANDITYSPTAMIISDPLYSKLSKIIQLYHNNLKGYKNYIESLFNSIYNENGELVKTRVSASSSPVYIAYSIDIEPVIEIVDEYIKNKNLSFDFDKIKLELLELNRLEEQFTQQELKTNHLLYWKDN